MKAIFDGLFLLAHLLIFWVLWNHPQTILESHMISRTVRFSLATLIAAAVGVSPITVMAADPAPASAPMAAPAAAPAEAPVNKAAEKKAAKKAKKDKKAEKKAKKKSKKKAKAATEPAAQ
jgi:hypothetical protein